MLAEKGHPSVDRVYSCIDAFVVNATRPTEDGGLTNVNSLSSALVGEMYRGRWSSPGTSS